MRKKHMKKIDYEDVKVVDSAYLRNNWSKITKTIEANANPIIVRKRNEEKFVIINIDEYEDYLDSINPKLAKSIQKGKADYKKGKFFTLDQVMKKYNIK
jgi:PHD/YefM family antitoxin component YafN of YafNO toxin-antitoxin module